MITTKQSKNNLRNKTVGTLVQNYHPQNKATPRKKKQTRNRKGGPPSTKASPPSRNVNPLTTIQSPYPDTCALSKDRRASTLSRSSKFKNESQASRIS